MSSEIGSSSQSSGGDEPRMKFKVSFALSEEEKRWAPGSSERLWAEKTDVRTEMIVKNIPFYVKGIAYLDRIRARADDAARELVFDELVEGSGGSTVRAIVKSAESRGALESVLSEYGCTWEIDSSGWLWAVDVPAEVDYSRLHPRLTGLVISSAIEIEEAAISAKHEGGSKCCRR